MKNKFLLAIAAAPFIFTGSAHAAQQQYCREYTKNVQIAGGVQSTYGQACLQPDGSWKVVSSSDNEIVHRQEVNNYIVQSPPVTQVKVVKYEPAYRPYYPWGLFGYITYHDRKHDYDRRRHDHHYKKSHKRGHGRR